MGAPVFHIDTDGQYFAGTSVFQWRGDVTGDGNPSVFKNTSSTGLTLGSITIPGNALLFHPGPGGEYSIVRFTAPTTGDYSLSASFIGRDVGGTTTDVHVLNNGSSLFNGLINGYGSTTALSQEIVHLLAGSTIDFAVGYGNNGSFSNDSTGLEGSLSITAVPEVSTMIAAVLLLVPFGAGAIRSMRKNVKA